MKPYTDTPFSLPNVAVAEVTCMDDPSRPPVVVEKLCKTVRLICFLIQNGVSKSKVMQDVHLVMKRGKDLGKALNNVVVRHHEALTCRSRDAHMSFVSPMDYQFSCSGSPPRPSHSLSHLGKRRPSPPYTRRQQHHALHYSRETPVHRVVGLCRGSDTLVRHYSMGGRVKIRGSRSASMLSESEDAEPEYRVDEAAEEFIERFYRELRLQKWLDHYC